jgi:hypothetical protein
MCRHEGKEQKMDKERIAEIERILSNQETTVEKEVALAKKGYIKLNNIGEIEYTRSANSAAPLTKNLLSKIRNKGIPYETKKQEFTNKMPYCEIEGLKMELKAIKSGFSSVKEMEADKYKKKKELFEKSIFNKITDGNFYYDSGNDIIFDKQKVIYAIVQEAKKQGMELYHISKEENEKSSSYYLKKDGDKVRISGHELPVVLHRTDMDYKEEWARNLVIDQGEMTVRTIIALKTKEELSLFVKNYFGIDQGREEEKHIKQGEKDNGRHRTNQKDSCFGMGY